MLILISNDDGITAPGIRSLAAAFRAEHEVWVIAPAREQSGAAHKLTFGMPLRARQHGEYEIAVDGTPTDAVYLALHHFLPRRPDLVLSGINRGANMGDDVTYSGTVGAAMEAAIQNIPAMAFSLEYAVEMDYSAAAAAARYLVEKLPELELPAHTMLNVNVPLSATSDKLCFVSTIQGRRNYCHEVISRQDPRGMPYYWIGGNPDGYHPTPGSDTDALAAGFISVTPLRADLTHHAYLTDLRKRLK